MTSTRGQIGGRRFAGAWVRPGRAPFDRNSPFFVGLVGALGVVVAVALAWLVVEMGQVLVLLGSPCSSPSGSIPRSTAAPPPPAALGRCLRVLAAAAGLFVGSSPSPFRSWSPRPTISPARSRTTCTA